MQNPARGRSELDLPSVTAGSEPGQNRAAGAPFRSDRSFLVSEAGLAAFCSALCEDGAEAFGAELVDLFGSVEAAGEALLAPAARRLGQGWADDETDFAAVTLGAASLQRLLWRLVQGRRTPVPPRGQLRLLLAVVPGEQHSFGLNLLCEALRERGAAPIHLPCPTAPELEAAVRSGGFEAVGLSVGSDEAVERLPGLCAMLRKASPTPLRLLAGGPAAFELRALASLGGVDEVVADAPVERLCELLFAGAGRAAA